MRQCNRCGERNHDDARYCGTCGQSMSAVDEPPPVVEDGAELDDDTAPGPGPGAAGLTTSEYVSAPTFGETGTVSAPAARAPVDPSTTPAPHAVGATVVVPPPAGPPPQSRRVGNGSSEPAAGAITRTSSSAGVMIAVLVVAAVVTVGGVFILLSRGSGDTEVARTGGDQAAPVGTATGTLPGESPATLAPTDSTPTDSAQVDPAATSTVPPLTAATTPPVATAVPVSETTVPPEPAPAPPPAPTRGRGDLGLTQPILDEACDGRYITFVGSAVGDRPYSAVVDELLGLYPGTNYIWTKACPSLRQEFTDGADIYGVVFGPYATQQEACNARAFGPTDAYVRRISTFDPQDHTIRC